jgi:Cu(I)-responsive transcriptional regulator
MNISQASERSGLPPKTIRYYEEIGLVNPKRRQNGYRDYDTPDIHKLAFLQRARGLGFSIEDCRALFSLYNDRHRASADVKRIAEQRIADIDRKIEELQSLRTTLGDLVDTCHGDERADCPILDDLSGRIGR